MVTESWKPIQGFESTYEVSNLGRVKRIKSGRILKGFTAANTGYIVVDLCVKNIHKQHSVHRLVAMTFLPNPNHEPCVNHIDGNKHNNAVSNLEWVSYSQNLNHAYRTGLRAVTEETKNKISQAHKKRHLEAKNREVPA